MWGGVLGSLSTFFLALLPSCNNVAVLPQPPTVCPFLVAMAASAGPDGRPARLDEILLPGPHSSIQAKHARKQAALARLMCRVPENILLAVLGAVSLASPSVPVYVKI